MHFFKTVVTPDKIRLSFEYMGRATLWSDVAMMAMTVAICCLPSLSRMYVELPTVPEATDTFELQPMYSVVKSPSAVNESIFAHDLAYLEAAGEDVSRRDVWP
jgi:hypothetical protein